MELFSVSSSLNYDARRIADIKDMPPKCPCSSTALEFAGSLCRHQRNAAISMTVCSQHLAMHPRYSIWLKKEDCLVFNPIYRYTHACIHAFIDIGCLYIDFLNIIKRYVISLSLSLSLSLSQVQMF